jgi:hypothetical protein
VTGLTPVFKLAQGAPNLVPITDANASSIDFENRTLNAGLVPKYSIGDRVWLDKNGDGVLGPEDKGVSGVTVELLGSGPHVLATEVTSKTGRYTFDHLPEGNYQIRFSKVPHGLVFTSQDAGDDPAIDSDVNQDGMTAVFALGSERAADSNIDAGLTEPANYRGASGSNRPAVDAALSTTGGLGPQLPILGVALAAVVGVGYLLVARRRRHS